MEVLLWNLSRGYLVHVFVYVNVHVIGGRCLLFCYSIRKFLKLMLIMMINLFQETVLNFIHDAYHNQNGNLFVPEHLRMSRDITNPRIAAKLKAYRTRNRYFVFSIWYILMQC